MKMNQHVMPYTRNKQSIRKKGNVVIRNDGRIDFIETSHNLDNYLYALRNIVLQHKTSFQDVLIADTYQYGRILALDGAIQSAESDELMYHELLVHPAMLAHPNPQKILIIGGGEGATLREVLKHSTVKNVTMVDIDAEAVLLCKEHLFKWHQGAFNDPRLNLVFQDGREYIEAHEEHYDVIIIDVVDMLDNGPAQKLYTRQFYATLLGKLSSLGIISIQAMELSTPDVTQHALVARTVATQFKETHSYHATIPSFLSSWSFILASNWFNPSHLTASDYDKRIIERTTQETLTHIDGYFFLSCLTPCKKIRQSLAIPGPVLEDDKTFTSTHST